MSRKFLIIPLLIVLVGSLIFGACTAAPAPAPTPSPTPTPAPTPTETIELKVNYEVPAVGITHRFSWVPFKEAVEERTGGKVKVTLFPGAALGRMSEAYAVTESGVADISWFSHATYPGRFPLFELFNLPLGIPTFAVGQSIVKELWKQFPEVIEAQHPGVKFLSMHADEGEPLYMAKEKVLTLEDLKGKRIGAERSIQPTIEILGGAPIALWGPDLYMALEKGTLDGAAFPYSPSTSFKLFEVVKYAGWVRWGSASHPTVMNLDTWNKLSPEFQSIILEEAWRKEDNQASAQIPFKNETMKAWEGAGCEFYELDPEELAKWEKMYQPLYDDYVENTEKLGLPGKQFLDIALRIVKESKR